MDDVYNRLMELTDFLLRYFVVLAAVGALAMALLELWKKIAATELRYHAKALATWFGFGGPKDSEIAFGDLLHLGIGIPRQDAASTAAALLANKGVSTLKPWADPPAEYALFALPLERMMGHIQNAADVALQNHARYPELFAFLASGAHEKDVADWKVSVAAAVDPASLVRRADLYSRLQLAARQKLAAFQLYTDQRWVNRNQRFANIVGVVILAGTLYWTNDSLGWGKLMPPGGLVLFCLAGGMLAPVAKDVVVALHKVRQR